MRLVGGVLAAHGAEVLITMATVRRSLVVVCLCAPPETHQLTAQLRRVDIEPEVRTPSDWPGASDAASPAPTILCFDPAWYPRERLLNELTCTKRLPTLTVLPQRAGAWDDELLSYSDEFVAWPCSDQELTTRLDRALAGWSSSDADVADSRFLEACGRLRVIGRSPAFTRSMRLIERVARCDAPVLIQGETGVGKELAARAVHYLGARRQQPFVPVNCGALPDSLVENELFGHERGAYTDAREPRDGLIAQAEGGALFLDEVEALSAKAQVVLLRFLQDRLYQPLGSRRQRQANVRVIAASNTDLSGLAAHGQFRADLLYRLSVVVVPLPPLRQRRDDIRPLAEEFVRQACERYGLPIKLLHPTTLEWMAQYRWPGNVRELENFVHQACVTGEGRWIHVARGWNGDGDDSIGDSDLDLMPSFSEAKAATIAEFEKRYLEHLMSACEGNVTRAARRAGKERRALGKLLKRYGLHHGAGSGARSDFVLR